MGNADIGGGRSNYGLSFSVAVSILGETYKGWNDIDTNDESSHDASAAMP